MSITAAVTNCSTRDVHFHKLAGTQMVALWLAHWTSGRAVRIPALLCSWARHFTLTVRYFTQEYKWVLANLILGLALRWTSIPSTLLH